MAGTCCKSAGRANSLVFSRRKVYSSRSLIPSENSSVPAKPKCLSQMYLRTRRGPVVVGDILYAPGGSFGPRTQMDFQFVVIHCGCLRLQLGEDSIHVPENHCILLSPGHREHFFFAPDRATRHSWVAVDQRAIASSMRKALQLARGPIPFLGKMTALFEMLRAQVLWQECEEVLQNGVTQNLALALLCEFASAVTGGCKAPNANDAVLSRLDKHLTGAYAQTMTLGDIAKATGISRQHLLKICRSAGRSTPMQQLYRKRLEAAAELLLHTGFPLSQIAEQCGFANPFHFSRKYKQLWGESPLSWRKTQWTGGDRPMAGK